MMPRIAIASALMAGLLVAQPAMAEDYDFEFDIGFSSLNFDGSQTITTNLGSIFNSNEIETDELSLSGTWYFNGLSDDKGPRARATLVDRASSLAIGYSQTDSTFSTVLTNTDPTFPFPPIDSRIDSDDDTFAANFRYVGKDSGWIGSIGLVTTEVTVGAPINSSFDATGWGLGFGKYIAENTTLELEISQVDADGGSDASAFGVTFEHLGNFNDQWQYAVDLGYNRVDADGGPDVDTWRAAVSMYPNRDVEFGLAIQDGSSDLPGSDALGFEGFASWFVRPNFKLSASYRVDDVDYLGNVAVGAPPTSSSADQDAFGINATVRF